MSDVGDCQELVGATGSAKYEAHIEIELGKAEDNPAKFYGKMTAGKHGTVIFQKKSTEPVEIKIGEDIPLSPDDVAARGDTFDVNAKLYYSGSSTSMVNGKTTFDIKEGTYTKTISGPNGSLTVTVTFNSF